MRKWDANGMADEDDGVVLDYSASADTRDGARVEELDRASNLEDIKAESFGTRTGKGQFVLKDLDDQVHSILKDSGVKKSGDKATTGVVGTGLNAISSLFRNVVGGKVLTKSDLEKPLKGMEEHLLNKNVAREAAVRLCEGVERELVGVKTGNFESALSPSTIRGQY